MGGALPLVAAVTHSAILTSLLSLHLQTDVAVKFARLEASETAACGIVGTTAAVHVGSVKTRTASLVFTAPDPHAKLRRKLTRWEELTGVLPGAALPLRRLSALFPLCNLNAVLHSPSGNCPRWQLSIMRTQRLRHLPVFTPLAIPLDAPSQQKSRSASVFKRNSLAGVGVDASTEPRRKSIIESFAQSIGLHVPRDVPELQSPHSFVSDTASVDSDARFGGGGSSGGTQAGVSVDDWRKKSQPLWKKVFSAKSVGAGKGQQAFALKAQSASPTHRNSVDSGTLYRRSSLTTGAGGAGGMSSDEDNDGHKKSRPKVRCAACVLPVAPALVHMRGHPVYVSFDCCAVAARDIVTAISAPEQLQASPIHRGSYDA